jgi:hypothetical protein
MGTLLFSKQINPHLTLGVEDTANVVFIVPTVEGSKQRTITVSGVESLRDELTVAKVLASMVDHPWADESAPASAAAWGWTVL